MTEPSDLPPSSPNLGPGEDAPVPPPPPTPPTPPAPPIDYSTPGPPAPPEISTPATALMAVGAVYCVGGVCSIMRMAFGMALGAIFGGNSGLDMMFSGVSGALVLTFTLLFGLFMIYAGMQMKALRNYNIALGGAVVGMLPCTCCCAVGLPVGVWVLVVLLKPEVKGAFR